MELRDLRCFVAVAEDLNFGRAAVRLHITQPGLSQRIKALERDLGVRLFERSRQGVTLTAAGEEVLAEVHLLLAQAARITSLAAYLMRNQHNALTLGHTRSAGVGLANALTAAFRRAHPEVLLETPMGYTASNIERVLIRDLDVAFVRAVTPLPDELAAFTVAHDPVMIAIRSEHPLAQASTLSIADVASEPLIFFPKEHAPGMWSLILDGFYGADRHPPISRVEPEESLMLAAVAEGVGVSMITRPSAEVLEVPGVVIRDLLPPIVVPLELIWRRDDANPALIQFLAFARTYAAPRRRRRQT